MCGIKIETYKVNKASSTPTPFGTNSSYKNLCERH